MGNIIEKSMSMPRARAWIAAILLTFTLSAVAAAEEPQQFQPQLPSEGSRAWSTEIRTEFDWIDFDAMLAYELLLGGEERERRLDELEEERREFERQRSEVDFHLEWLPYTEPALRLFSLRATHPTDYRLNYGLLLPPRVEGVVDSRGNLIDMLVGEYPLDMLGISFIVPFPDHAVEVVEGDQSIHIDRQTILMPPEEWTGDPEWLRSDVAERLRETVDQRTLVEDMGQTLHINIRPLDLE